MGMSYYDIGAILAGFLVQSLIGVVTYLKSRDNGRKTDKLVSTVAQNTGDISAIVLHTNGMKDALVKLTGESEHAKGVLQGKAERQQGDK